jgi:hypothetical protein
MTFSLKPCERSVRMDLIKKNPLFRWMLTINKNIILQFKALFFLVLFLIIMAVLTLVSKHNDEFVIPQVITTSLKSMIVDNVIVPNCIPLKALHREGAKHYVLVVLETDTVLGTETVTQRVDVSIEYKNKQYASLNNTLVATQKIIVSSNKPIESGDRIKVKDG